jgi:hypothetical protein
LELAGTEIRGISSAIISRRAAMLAVSVATLLALPSLCIGVFMDDYAHLAILEGYPMVGKPFDLFTFAPGDAERLRPFMERGPFPWWTYPEARFSFFRPLSSALAVFDHAVFGRHFVWWHVHSILWYAVTVFAAGLVLRRALPAPTAAAALLLFAIDDVHWMPAAWLANRNSLVSAAPSLLGLYAHLRWRQDGWRPGLVLSLAGYGAGLLGGETALAAPAYALAYEACAGPGVARQRVRAIMPAALLVFVYLLLYKFYGYGASGSGT